jgi:hypothetical protein
MSLTELFLLIMGALIFAAALSLVIGIASRLITVAQIRREPCSNSQPCECIR